MATASLKGELQDVIRNGMDGWSNGELQEVIRNGRMPGIQSIAVCFYSNAARNLEALILSESFKISPSGRDDRHKK